MISQVEYEKVMQLLSTWPEVDRVALGRKLLTQERSRRVGLSVDDLVGIARGSGPAPTDAEVEKWIDEARMEKYDR